MTIHDFDMARFLLGEIVEVQAAGANLVSAEIAEVGDIDSASIMLRGADGTLCQIINSRRCAFGYDQRVEAFGELGMLTVENLRPTGVRFADGTATEVADPYLTFFLDRYIPSYRAELDHFVTAVETGTRPNRASPTAARPWLSPTRPARASARVASCARVSEPSCRQSQQAERSPGGGVPTISTPAPCRGRRPAAGRPGPARNEPLRPPPTGGAAPGPR